MGKHFLNLGIQAQAVLAGQRAKTETRPPRLPPPCPCRLSAQIHELKQQLAEATNTVKTTTPMSQSASPVQPGEVYGSPGGDTGGSSPGGFAPAQAAAGQGYIYVMDPALQVEIERLRETVADRERVIEDLEMGGRHNVHAVSATGVEGMAVVGRGVDKIYRTRHFLDSAGCGKTRAREATMLGLGGSALGSIEARHAHKSQYTLPAWLNVPA